MWQALITCVLLLCLHNAVAQDDVSPCPEVLIDQKYDHIAARSYRAHGWDTAITCAQRTITLTSEPYMPVKFFNGTYNVEQVKYNPPDPTYSTGKRMPVGTDDDFSADTTQIPFPFYFFGLRKEGFRLGANGLISFATDQFTGGNGCPWEYTAELPWPDGKSGVPQMPEGATGNVPLARMRDAIYGVYEDTHPIASYLSGRQGIYYGIQGEWPCRKIICSWNGIPEYKGSQNLDNRSTYQIVCYEGSNIIEVHIKHRAVNTNWNNGAGLVGIQNATGQPQTGNEDRSASDSQVEPGSPAAFWPDDLNLFSTTLDTVAYRFTPMGRTASVCRWYALTDAGDSIELSTVASDTNGYVIPMDVNSPHPTLTKAIVSPTKPTRYVVALYFQTADNKGYYLKDTIFVGIDTSSNMLLKGICGTKESTPNSHQLDICRGSTADIKATYSDIQTAESITWAVERIAGGNRTALEDSLYTITDSLHTLRIGSHASRYGNESNMVDSIYLQSSITFTSQCSNHDTFLLRIMPYYDITEHYGICIGDTFRWHNNGQTYSATTDAPTVRYTAASGCDSIVRLNLTVYDVSLTPIEHTDCKPYTWINGITYATTNSATTATDTVVVQNRYGCDSVLQLHFTLTPVEAKILTTTEYLDYSNLDAELTDASTGSNACRWLLPDGSTSTQHSITYTMPTSLDTAHIALVAYSPHGCTDTTHISLPFIRENIWIPNIFTPDLLDANNRFAPRGKGWLDMEMHIYNRYGMLVYECRGISCEWDGRDTNGLLCQQGAYVYVIRYRDVTDPTITKLRQGAITLIR